MHAGPPDTPQRYSSRYLAQNQGPQPSPWWYHQQYVPLMQQDRDCHGKPHRYKERDVCSYSCVLRRTFVRESNQDDTFSSTRNASRSHIPISWNNLASYERCPPPPFTL